MDKNLNHKSAVFYIPHADDEVLHMGVAIIDQIWAGWDVHVVLLTHGKASKSYHYFDGSQDCPLHGKTHASEEQLTIAEFGLSRADEFLRSIACMEVDPMRSSVHHFPDGGLTTRDVKLIVQDYENRYPGSLHQSFSWIDDHPDHVSCGQAIRELHQDGSIQSSRFYFKNSLMDENEGKMVEFEESYRPFFDAAIEVYKRWNPQGGMYAIGYHSVKDAFDRVKRLPRSKYHDIE